MKDVQQSPPSIALDLTRVGVTNLRRIVSLGSSPYALFFAELDLYVDLGANQKGVHMSRFSKDLEDMAAEVAAEPAPDLETIAERMALLIARSQGAHIAQVHMRAQYPITRRTPVSGIDTQSIYTFLGYAASNGISVRRAVGVEAQGLTVCPCAQEMSAQKAVETLIAAGYAADEAQKITELLPMPSHNQRGMGTIIVGCEDKLNKNNRISISAEDLVHLAESSMSSEIYEILKRPDELFVVDKGHRNPRFVEDVVRNMLMGILDVCSSLGDDTFYMAKQENFESIHLHNVSAQKNGLLGDLRTEYTRTVAIPLNKKEITLDEWLSKPFKLEW